MKAKRSRRDRRESPRPPWRRVVICALTSWALLLCVTGCGKEEAPKAQLVSKVVRKKILMEAPAGTLVAATGPSEAGKLTVAAAGPAPAAPPAQAPAAATAPVASAQPAPVAAAPAPESVTPTVATAAPSEVTPTVAAAGLPEMGRIGPGAQAGPSEAEKPIEGFTPLAYAYNPAGKINPFKPLISQESVTAKGAPVGGVKIPRPPTHPPTPLEKFDLAQLKLVAVLHTRNKDVGLIQAPTGKGYVVKEGSYIGMKEGKVARILKDRIVVDEIHVDLMGNESIRPQELMLQKMLGVE